MSLSLDENRPIGESPHSPAPARHASNGTRVEAAKDWLLSEDSPEPKDTQRFAAAVDAAMALRARFGLSHAETVDALADQWALFATPELAPREIEQAVETAFAKAPLVRPRAPAAAATSAPQTAGRLKLDWALDAARRGFPVFPLMANSKKPPAEMDRWQYRATTDEAQIRQWWTRWPDANIACFTGSLFVYDIDPRNGGDVTFEKDQMVEGFPQTLVSKTAGGGNHLFFSLPPHTVVRVPKHAFGKNCGVDGKSWGGYVVLPGSTIDGNTYEWMNDRQPAEVPQWILDRCRRPAAKSENAGERLIEENDAAVALAEAHIRRRAEPVAEGSRDDAGFKMAADLYDFGVSLATCEELLAGWNEAYCHPPLEPHDIARLARSAGKNRQEAIGSRNPEVHGFEAVDIEQYAAAPATHAPAVIVATPLRRLDPATIPPVPWVVRGLAARGKISTLTGPGGVSKSTWTLQLAVAVAAGRSDIAGYEITKRECVWVWSQEDDIAQMELRVAAIMQAFSVTHDDLCGENGRPMLYLNSGLGRGKRLTLVKRVGETLRESEQFAAMLAQAKEIKPGLIVLDPLISLHQAGENDNVQMRAVFDCISPLAVEADTAVLIVSHTGKPDKGSSKGFAGDSYASRGASAQPDAARHAVTFLSLSEDDAKKRWRLPAGKTHLDYVRIDDSKTNLGKLRRAPRLFAREDVLVTGFTGDSMEVLRPVALETREKTGAPVMAHNIAKAIAENLPLDTPHSVATILPHLPEAEAAALREQKNRARVFDAVFDGADVVECLTDYGKLKRAKGPGNKGTLLTLYAAPQHLKTVSEAEPSA